MAGKKRDLKKIIRESEALRLIPCTKDGRLAFINRGLVLATMPHKNPNGNYHVRKNGNYTLSMAAVKQGVGLPYGTIPRLVMIYLATQAIKTKNKEISLGKSLGSFFSDLGMLSTGGRWGTITRFKEQVNRLVNCAISSTYEDEHRKSYHNIVPISAAVFWWDLKNIGQRGLQDSTITLSTEFYDELIKSPIPTDLRVLRGLTKSPLAIDIYVWASYRRWRQAKQVEIPWAMVQGQFGSDYADDHRGRYEFKRKFMHAVKLVQVYDNDCILLARKKGLIIMPTPSHIPPPNQNCG